MYGQTKKDLFEILKKLCEMKQIQIIEGKVCIDHIHMYVAIPPKISVSEFKAKRGDKHFWARGYYVATVGNVNEETIREYIRNQEENDKLEDE